MKNYVQPGDAITLTAPYAVTSGAGVLVGSLFGVSAFTAATGEEVEAVTSGVFDLASATGASTAIAAGAFVYWDDTNKVATGTSTGNSLIGVAILAKADGGTTVRVRLNGAFTA